MEKIYNFCTVSIATGHTILIYRGWTAKTAKHVKRAGRLDMIGDVMYCDGVSCEGLTICLKP